MMWSSDYQYTSIVSFMIDMCMSICLILMPSQQFGSPITDMGAVSYRRLLHLVMWRRSDVLSRAINFPWFGSFTHWHSELRRLDADWLHWSMRWFIGQKSVWQWHSSLTSPKTVGNHDISWYIVINHDKSWYIVIYHDLSRNIKTYHDISW